MIDIEQIRKAQETIGLEHQWTRVPHSPTLTDVAGAPVFLKLEIQQVISSFKIRGAVNAIKQLSSDKRQHGVVCFSSGNHGRGVAYGAKQEGIQAYVFMSGLVPQNKVQAIRDLGAVVKIVGDSQDDAEAAASQLIDETGATMLSPFDDPEIISGQGTIGLELFAQLPEMAAALVPLSGGGLISGIAIALKALNPSIRIIGVSMERGAAMHESIQQGCPTDVKELPTLADALGGNIGLDNEYTFQVVKDLVDEIVLVSEQEIASAIHHLYWKEKQIVEGAGAVGVAAILAKKVRLDGLSVAVVSGGNIDMDLHHKIISGKNVEAGKH